jgi:hypothetical protein
MRTTKNGAKVWSKAQEADYQLNKFQFSCCNQPKIGYDVVMSVQIIRKTVLEWGNLDSRFPLLNKLQAKTFNLRKSGLKFSEIGKRFGVSTERSRQIYRCAMGILTRAPYWSDGLSVRAENCLNNCNITSRAELIKAYQSGILSPLKRPRNYGWHTHKEVAKWLGFPEPIKPKRKILEACLYCGRKFQ